tara:strand:- start:38 stop:223 length:186 start_codon:yes stop_codon:yes gene_type:complete
MALQRDRADTFRPVCSAVVALALKKRGLVELMGERVPTAVAVAVQPLTVVPIPIQEWAEAV